MIKGVPLCGTPFAHGVIPALSKKGLFQKPKIQRCNL